MYVCMYIYDTIGNFFNQVHRVPGVEIKYPTCRTRNSQIQIFSTFFLDFRISVDKFFIICHIGLGDGLKNPLLIIYQYAIIIWVILDPIAEILRGVKLTLPQAEWVNSNPPSRIELINTFPILSENGHHTAISVIVPLENVHDRLFLMLMTPPRIERDCS